ncbi:hypothetical protein [Kutzneria sp. 744]|uniref:hypothetical protein n=1 Tax=Kutzneria sp. (strain 744) TaxID=345341 RepID=UPI0003EEDF4E|nr:hypothetical protein [Kutzneria sp. 744]EWM19640.1 PE-PGRS family protein [Kutzneria sp. 744]
MTTTERALDNNTPSRVASPDTSTHDADTHEITLVLPTSAQEVKDFKLLHVDPDELVIGRNARAFKHEDLDPDFVHDLSDRGNYVPIIARFDAHGQLVVRDGQVRTHGLREAKRLAVDKHGDESTWHKALVLAQEHDITDERAAEIERLVEQHGANFLRFAMTEADHLRTVQGLLELGVEPEKVGKKLRLKANDAAVLVAVAKSTHAAELAHQGVLGLSESAVIAEFEAFGDENEAVAALTEVAQSNPRHLHQTAQRLREARTERLAVQIAAAELAAQGVTVIERPDTLYGPQIRQIADLRPTARTRPGSTLSVKRHSTCPGHAAFLSFRRTWQDREGAVTVIHVCTDFQKHKHAERNAEPGQTLLEGPTNATSGGGTQQGPTTAEKKAYRKTVIANGKAWDLATIKRMEALELFAKRRSLSQAEDTWLEAMRATSSRYADAASKGHRLALKLLGWDTKFAGYGNKPSLRAEILKAKPERARIISMVMVLAAVEQGASRRTTWENPSDEEIAYFAKLQTLKLQTMEPTGLADWELSDVEALVLNRSAPVDAAVIAAVVDELEVEATPDDEDGDTDLDDGDTPEALHTPATVIDTETRAVEHDHELAPDQ